MAPIAHTDIVLAGYGNPGGGYGGPPGYPPPAGPPGGPYGGGYGGGAPPPYGAPPPVGFGGPGFGGPPMGPMQKTHALAITSLVTGIVSILPSCCCLGFLGIPVAIAGVITGALGLMKIKAAPDQFKGNGLAIAGIVCASLGLVFGVLELVPGVVDQREHARSGSGSGP